MTLKILLGLASLMIATLGATAFAQQNIVAPEVDLASGKVVSAILTVDIDWLFSQSQFGQRVAQSYAAEREALATENSRIASTLREEELILTAQRADMALDVFRTEAEDFDAKAQNIRSAQDAKERALEDTLAQGRDQFFEVTRPILGQLMVDRGAFAILDRRSVILSLGSIDVTEEAIARIDALIGEGTAATLGTDDNLYPDTEVEN
ncbi:MAG: Skp family chaperone for outer membrane protein [Octadecabacter sp.]|jgi:Skp family chaperone for outer membrane proteins